MTKDKENGIPRQAWIRVGLFALLVGGLFWFLAGDVRVPSGGQVEGEKTKPDFLPEEMSEGIQILGERIGGIIPDKTQEEIIKTAEKTKLVEEIKKTVVVITEEIQGFPQKQEKEIKKQIIQEVCNQLLEDLESE